MLGQRALVGLLAATFAAVGLAKVARSDRMREQFTRWSLPGSLLPVVGLAEIAGAGMLLFPQTRPLGVAVLAPVVGGATLVHVGHGEIGHAAFPVLYGLGLAAISAADRR